MDKHQYAGFLDQYGATADPRISDWPLMNNSNTVLAISAIYIYIVKYIGPQLMKNREPFDLKRVIMVYNAIQIASCAFLMYKFIGIQKSLGYNVSCEELKSQADIELVNGLWWTLNLKLMELIETVFFVMRKKQSQVSKLHVYHHVSTFLLMWIGTKYAAGKFIAFYICLNCAVHICMYAYYTAAAFGSPQVIKVLNRLKKYITIIQMVQFTIMLIHAGKMMTLPCSIPKMLLLLFIPNVTLVFVMFINFYINSYKKKIN